jgi:hypothetical protein
MILLRGAGDPDYAPTAEPRLARAMAIAYDMKAPPSAADIAAISEVWKPYRTWVALLLRIMLEDETHEIGGQAITRTPGRDPVRSPREGWAQVEPPFPRGPQQPPSIEVC